jgi:broad specificity phosphatase PhoE
VRQTQRLAAQLQNVSIDAAVHTRFKRTATTARLVLDRPGVLIVCEPFLDDVGCGSFEGVPIAEDHAWRAARPRSARPPRGESIVEASRRSACGLRRITQRPEEVLLLVTHELSMRYLINGAAGSEDIAGPRSDVPNALPFLFDGESVERAAGRIEEALSGQWVDAGGARAG